MSGPDLLHAPPAPRPAAGIRIPKPRVGLGSSCLAFIRESCRQTDLCHGAIEIPWFIFGSEVDGFLLGFKALIPRASCGEASFEVAPRDLSALNRRMAAARPDLRLMVVAHRHPGLLAPLPSGVDQRDRDRMARLFSVLNRRSLLSKQVLEPRGNGDGFHYRLAWQGRSVELRLDPGAPGASPATPPPRLLWEEHVSISFHGFVILNSEGDPEQSYAQVVRICSDPLADAGDGGPEVAVFECPLEVLRDEEVARLAGLPVERVTQQVSPAAVRRIVEVRLRRRSYLGRYRYDAGAGRYRPRSGYAWERHERVRSVQAPGPNLEPEELRDLVDGESLRPYLHPTTTGEGN